MRGISIVAPDTDAGKTVITAALLSIISKVDTSVAVMKPIQTGAIFINEELHSEDLLEISKLTGIAPNTKHKKLLQPYLFKKACSPHLAAIIENCEIQLSKILDSYNQLSKIYKTIIVETAGGVLSPISYDSTNCDLITSLKTPTILVTPNRLGTISQTLSAIESLVTRDIKIVAVVLNDSSKPSSDFEEKLFEENRVAIQKMGGVSTVIRTPFLNNLNSKWYKLTDAISPLIPILEDL
jgi:dethiobiotin synthetase